MKNIEVVNQQDLSIIVKYPQPLFQYHLSWYRLKASVIWHKTNKQLQKTIWCPPGNKIYYNRKINKNILTHWSTIFNYISVGNMELYLWTKIQTKSENKSKNMKRIIYYSINILMTSCKDVFIYYLAFINRKKNFVFWSVKVLIGFISIWKTKKMLNVIFQCDWNLKKYSPILNSMRLLSSWIINYFQRIIC